MKIEESKEEFIKIFKENIVREGSDKLLEWLHSTDFFVAPASTRAHSNVEGGLCFHSVNAYYRYKKMLESEYGSDYLNVIDNESIAIIGLLHDVCKANFYKVDYRNVKVNEVWTKQPYFMVEDSLPYGHGEKSVYIINGFIRLTREEAMAINWHMGEFDNRVKGGAYGLADVFYKYTTTFLFHLADMSATYLDETIKK